MSAWDMAEKIRTQELTSVEITDAIIERIEKLNPIINAYCTMTFDLARDMAKAADEKVKKGQKFGLLNGIPVSIKDLMMTKGIRTTFGSKLYENFIPEEDSIIVNRIKKAGCVILGKTNTPEFGFKGVTDNLIFGVTKNPWNLKKTSGGSTGGGGAAVASGLGPLTVGTDAGGSIRIPSCFCGVYGIKPSFGRVPIHPWPILHGEMYDHYGPLARYVEDAALMLDAIKGPDENDKYSLPEQNISYYEGIRQKPNKLRIAYSLDLGYAKIIDKEVEEKVINSVEKFEQFGWNIEKVKMKMRKPELAYYTLYTVDFAYDLQGKLKEWKDNIDPDLVKMIEAGAGYSGIDVMKAIDQRKAIYKVINQIFKDYDLLITPTAAVAAFELGIMFPPKINEKNVSPTAWQAFTFPINMTGHPAASIPCGWSNEGLPIGMQIIGKRFDELTVLQASKAFQEIAPWQDKRPNFN